MSRLNIIYELVSDPSLDGKFINIPHAKGNVMVLGLTRTNKLALVSDFPRSIVLPKPVVVQIVRVLCPD